MRIRIPRDAVCSEIPVPSGEYWVALRQDSKQIALISGGKDLLLPATRRRTRCRTKTVSIQWFTGGGSIWSLVILDPKHGEWVAFVDCDPKHGKK